MYLSLGCVKGARGRGLTLFIVAPFKHDGKHGGTRKGMSCRIQEKKFIDNKRRQTRMNTEQAGFL
jgi:hypothetical protein